MKGGEYETDGTIPGSVYSFLLNKNLMPDPYYRDNEEKVLAICDNDFEFSRKFDYKKESDDITLVLEGIDTLCDIILNGKKIAHLNNMHRTYKIPVGDIIVNGENSISAYFYSADKYVKEADKKNPRPGCANPLKGYMHLRKAHCMFGWDWGPRLPDAGIWRDIYLVDETEPRIDDVRILQRHEGGKVFVKVTAKTTKPADVKITVKSPDGEVFELQNGSETEIKNPLLWWPNGFDKQNLYTVIVKSVSGGKVTDESIRKIGLRTLKLVREKDEYGESFCHEINGKKIFAFGADYIPEDNILSRINKERTERLLRSCIYANFNAIRVWGGGYYPDDYFFDLCDELGLIVFFDLMFACSSYDYDEEFYKNALTEITDNIKRIRHHACIGLISGNNEIEEETVYWGEEIKKGYLELFENRIPAVMSELCPEIAYVPSSPSSFGGFNSPTDENYGDSHYWMVWHGNLPFTDYRKHYFRYLSEFGFQSFPSIKTIEEFTLPEDRNPFGRVMELHQRNPSANGKILNYLSQTYLYPSSFENLVYASQLLQAEAMKYGVEHLRRNRGRCMGTLYWQLNDIWPVASWSSIDSAERYKALHYEAKRFYEPVHISCEETGEYTVRRDITDERIIGYETKAKLYVNNETLKDVCGEIEWRLTRNDGKTLETGKENITVKALSVNSIEEIDFNKTDVRNNYLWFAFNVDGKTVSSGTVIFTKPKHFNFPDPKLKLSVSGDKITVRSDAYAKYVEITDETGKMILSDNYFDMNKGEKTVYVISGTPEGLKVKSVYDIR